MVGGREIRIIKGAPAAVSVVRGQSACKRRSEWTRSTAPDIERSPWLPVPRRCAGVDRSYRFRRSAAAGFARNCWPSCARWACIPVMVTGDAAATAATMAHASGSMAGLSARAASPKASARAIMPSMPAYFPSRNFSWSRRFSAKDMRSACAATAPTTRRRSGRRRWASPCPPQPMWPRPRPASC